jgi:flavin reductase (DIM6/NTAB) family NADH-FMN oxidoreductase RutF
MAETRWFILPPGNLPGILDPPSAIRHSNGRHMHYEPGVTPHGLPFNPFKSCVVPRPIGWISTTSREGRDNLAPYSQFQMVNYDPPMVMFSANRNARGARKDTVVNVEHTGEFVWNMATWALREAVNRTSEELPHGGDEFAHAGLAKVPSLHVKPPRVAASPIQFECRHVQTVQLPGNGPTGSVDVVFGRVVCVHVDDAFLRDGRIDIEAIRPLARLGYHDYTSVEHVFTMKPVGSPARLAGLEGSPEKMAEALRAMPGPARD